LDKWDCIIRALATSNKWPCFLSTILFCCGVFTDDVWCIIPLPTKKLVMTNSVPLSLLIIFIVVSNCVWTKITKCFKTFNNFRFLFQKKNPCVPRIVINYGQEIFMTMNWWYWVWSPNIYMNQIKTFFDLDVLIGKESLFCFAKWQTSQTKDLLYLTKGNLFLITSIHLFEIIENAKGFLDH